MSPEPIRPGSARRRREATVAPEPTEATEDTAAPAVEDEPTTTRAGARDRERDLDRAGRAPKRGAQRRESAVVPAPELPVPPEPGTEAPVVEKEATEEVLGEEAAPEAAAPATAPEAAEDGAPGDGAPGDEVAPPPARPVRHGPFARLYFGETNVEFVRRKRIWFCASILVIIIGVVSLGTRGLNLGIDFVGGTAWTVKANHVSVHQASEALNSVGLGGSTVTILGGNSPDAQLNIEAKIGSGEHGVASLAKQNRVSTLLANLTHEPRDSVSVSTVGPTWGSQITHKAVVALIVFFILIAIYISIFFEWRMAFAAIVAVLHDIIVTVGIYSLSGFEVTPDTVVAFLTILGYSLYDTIVVFDRIRDNVHGLADRGRLTFSELTNVSINQTLARSINTSLVAIMPILSVLVLGAEILGAKTLEDFGLALLIGLTTGAYSSLFIASPLVALLKEREPRYRRIRERIAARPGDRGDLSPAAIAAGLLAGSGSAARERSSDPTEASTRRETRPRAPAGRRPGGRPAARAKRRGGRR